MEQVKIIIGCF